MDEPLKRFLDGQNWEHLVRLLTGAALGFMIEYNWRGRDDAETNQRAMDYALDTMSWAYEACAKDLRGRFDLSRSAPSQFFTYLKINVLRRLITDDIEKGVRRSKWPLGPLEDGEDISAEAEEAASLTLTELVCEADDELGRFISAAVQQLDDSPKQSKVNWTQLQKDLEISKHRCDQLRLRMKEHLVKVQQAVLA